MVRLTFLGIALCLGVYAAALIVDAAALDRYLLRDSLVIALMAATIFALWAPSRDDTGASPPIGRRGVELLIAVTALAALLRLWRLGALPPDCIDAECQRALLVAEGDLSANLVDRLAALVFTVTGDGLLSQRLAGALLGALTVPALYLAARHWALPAGALLGVLLLAASPWHIGASRTGDPAIALPLLVCLALWAMMGALVSSSRLRWRYGGGLLIVLVLLVHEWWMQPWPAPYEDALAIANALLYAGAQPVGLPLLTPLAASLAFMGIGFSIRHATRWRYAGLLAASMLLAIGGLRLTPGGGATLWLLAVPLFLFATVALDRLFGQFRQTWRVLWRPAYLFAAALAMVAIIGLRDATAFLNRLDTLTTAGLTPAHVAISRHLASALQQPAAPTRTYVAPAAVVSSAATRLLAGSAWRSDAIISLEASAAVLPAIAIHGPPDHEVRVLIPAGELQWLQLWRQLFPGSAAQGHVDETSNELLFSELVITPDEWAANQGLAGLIVAENGFQRTLPAGAPHFDWATLPDLTPPFTVQGQGALLIPATGHYEFAVEGLQPTADWLTLQLDGQLVLDVAQGRIAHGVLLATGLYRLDLLYRFAGALDPATPPLRIRWQAPGREWETIPAHALLAAPLAPSGLLATLYDNDRWEGLPTTQRKDLFLSPPTEPDMPGSVRWQGFLASPRAGDYLFTATSDGVLQVRIDGNPVIESSPEGNETATSAGLIYLSQGWHALEVRFAATTAQPQLRLDWQAAGSALAPLPSRYTAPLLPGADGPPRLAPPAPPLADPALGDDAFALTPVTDQGQVAARIPPGELPALPFAMRWQAGEGCGDDERLLNQPHGVAIDLAHRRILVADTANRRVAMFDLAGALVGSIRDERFVEPFDIALAPDGRALLLDAVSDPLFGLDLETGGVTVLPVAGAFYRPRGLAVDGAGNLLIADTGGARVALLTADGQSTGQVGGPGSALGRGQPVGVLASGSGAHWAITAEDGRVWRLDNGGAVTAIQPTNTLNGPQLAGLPDGRLFVSDPARGRVLFLTANGQPRAQLNALGNLVTPTGLDARLAGDTVVLTVVDSATCTLSWWEAPAQALPHTQ